MPVALARNVTVTGHPAGLPPAKKDARLKPLQALMTCLEHDAFFWHIFYQSSKCECQGQPLLTKLPRGFGTVTSAKTTKSFYLSWRRWGSADARKGQRAAQRPGERCAASSLPCSLWSYCARANVTETWNV